MRKGLKLFFFLAFSLLGAVQSLSALDASVNLYAADRYYYRYQNRADAYRFQYDVTLSGNFTKEVNLSGTLWSSHKSFIGSGGFTVPEELDYQLNLSYNTPAYSLTAAGNVYTTTVPIYEAGIIADYYLSTPVDILSVTFEAAGYSDFKGFYQEVKVQPDIALPVSPIVNLSLPVTLGIAENQFGNLVATGLTGVQISPRLSVILSDNLNIAVSGGYFVGINPAIPSYPFVMAKVGFRFNTPEAVQ